MSNPHEHSLFVALLPQNVDEADLKNHIEHVLIGMEVTEIDIHRSSPPPPRRRVETCTATIKLIDNADVETLIAAIENENDIIIPDEFLDPITRQFMKDPVFLIPSNRFVDRSTIDLHLQLSPTDPFNEKPITQDMITPATERKQYVKKWLVSQLSTSGGGGASNDSGGGTRPQQHSLSYRLSSVPFQGQRIHVQNAKPNKAERKDIKTQEHWKKASQKIATEFHRHLLKKPSLLEQATDREQMGQIFREYWQSLLKESPSSLSSIVSSFTAGDCRTMEVKVMMILRRKELLKSKRRGAAVILAIAKQPGKYPSLEEQRQREKVIQKQNELLESNKKDIVVLNPATQNNSKNVLAPLNKNIPLVFFFTSADHGTNLTNITLGGATTQLKYFTLPDKIMRVLPISSLENKSIYVSFKAQFAGIYRCHVTMTFESSSSDTFSIRRHLVIQGGDEELIDVLKPTTPYVKKQTKFFERPPDEIIPAPTKERASSSYLAKLPFYHVPKEIREFVASHELESVLVKPEVEQTDLTMYTTFWQNLLWASELQAYKDIQLYDMDKIKLKKEGRMFVLHVPGLAESRPSVLRGDIVNITWKNKRYKGLVQMTRQLDVLLEFDKSFHKSFNVNLDVVNVRFTFTRTIFRTAHEGVVRAPNSMGARMLFPNPSDVTPPSMMDLSASFSNVSFDNGPISWANSNLNAEQKDCIENILNSTCAPLPYIIFGPPGTGKTTTLTEAVYQLARSGNSKNQQRGLNTTISMEEPQRILLVAPSNDASDILVEKLAPYFPTSEMFRALAFSRNVDDVSSIVRPYTQPGTIDDQLERIVSSRVVVSTVNLAARFAYFGVDKGHFDILCVDEAGHATEPEVIAVAATLMDFNGSSTKSIGGVSTTFDCGSSIGPDRRIGRLVLAGDPKQLGPVITSDLCKKFGLDVSYMERLCQTKSYSKQGFNNTYPSNRITKLVQNYRSHPAIMKLPNSLFYENELVNAGDVLQTHGMCRWEHLPKKSFPIIFHAVQGENLQEGTSPSWFNPQEAELVVHYVDLLVNHSKPSIDPEDIGIITPYARQAQKIRKALEVKHILDIKVGSVETFQGQERRCIILSTVRSESELLVSDMKYNLGFVSNEKRFNVALTRAQSLLIVIGNPKVLSTDKKNWLPFMRYCHENKSWAGEPWYPDADTDGSDANKEEAVDQDTSWELIDEISQAVEQEGLGYINREE